MAMETMLMMSCDDAAIKRGSVESLPLVKDMIPRLTHKEALESQLRLRGL